MGGTVKALCYVGISMHPNALRELGKFYKVALDDTQLPVCEAAIVYYADNALLDTAPNLRALGCHSCGKKLLQLAKECNVSLTLAAGLWRTVAEHTLALMMSAARCVASSDRALRLGAWERHSDLKVRYSGFDFQEKTVGIWGMGQIGRELASMLSGFHVRILYSDIYRLPLDVEKRLNAEYCEFSELLPECDYFSVLVPHNASTDRFLGKAQFDQMKDGVVFVNTARSGIVVEEDFYAALDSGKIGAAALDVIWREGEKVSERLAKYDNVVLTPHLGGSTFECDMELVRGVCRQVQ
ncbi:MAG: hypothetical protein LBB86_05605 [Oscillospiraceae bacterium]|nr:hypothetical protein [Oscillospiraceae bacterium]